MYENAFFFSLGFVKPQRTMGTHNFWTQARLSTEESVVEILLSFVCTHYIHAASL